MAEISLSNVSSGGGSTSPGGANTNVQYNDSGSFGGDALFVFDEANTRLGVGVATPDTTLNIEGPDQCVARFESTGVGGGIDLKDQSTTSNNQVGVGALGNNLCFRAGGVAQGLARLFSTGNLVVGSTLSDDGFQIETEDRDARFNGVRVGRGAGNVSTNTAVGASALNANTTGSNNTAIGGNSLSANTNGSSSVAIGSDALLVNNASQNTAVGVDAGRSNTSGTGLTAIGYQALRASTGNNNTALGFQSGLAVTTGADNTAVGYRALATATTGTLNTAFGSKALEDNTASSCSAFGESALANNTTGGDNTAVGRAAMLLNTTGSSCVAVGESALRNNNGSSNTAVGRNALQAHTTGTNNTALGASTVSGNFSGSTILGSGATANGNNQFVVGSASVNAGTVTVGAAAQTHYWTIKINGTDYKVLLAL